MKTDELGSYDECAIPKDLQLPLKVDSEALMITGADNFVIGAYSRASELAFAVFDRRRADFIVALANGDIAVSKGVVLRRIAEQWQDDRLVVTFLPTGSLTQEQNDELKKKIVQNGSKPPNTLNTVDFDSMSKTDQKKYLSLKAKVKKFADKMAVKYQEPVE